MPQSKEILRCSQYCKYYFLSITNMPLCHFMSVSRLCNSTGLWPMRAPLCQVLRQAHWVVCHALSRDSPNQSSDTQCPTSLLWAVLLPSGHQKPLSHWLDTVIQKDNLQYLCSGGIVLKLAKHFVRKVPNDHYHIQVTGISELNLQ